MGIMQTGDYRFSFQVEYKGARTDMGLDSGITANIDELTIFHCNGRRCAEFPINGIDVPVDVCLIGFLSVADRSRGKHEGQEQKKSRRYAGQSLDDLHRIRSFHLCLITCTSFPKDYEYIYTMPGIHTECLLL
jgi:hypothetical protein